MISKKSLLLAGLLAQLLLTTVVAYAGVDILNFAATQEGHDVRLTWQTSTETDHAYFNLWRSEENLQIVNGQIDRGSASVSRVNTASITSPNPCSASGQSYTVVDRGVPETASTVYYYLESFNCTDSQSEFKGDGNGGWRVDLSQVTLFLPTVSQP